MTGRDTPAFPWWIRKIDIHGREVYRWRARLVRHEGELWLFEAVMQLPAGPVEVGGLVFHPGDRVLEAYFTQRWYNILELYGPSGARLRGWYANLARPPVFPGPHELHYVDLALDLVVLPDGRMQEVDRESFEGLPLGEHERRRALRHWEGLRRAFARGQVCLQKGIFPPRPEDPA